MIFKGKTPDPMPFTSEQVFDPNTMKFHEFRGGRFETDDEEVIEFLVQAGYEAVDKPPEESFKCDLCEFVAKSKAGLGAHKRNHKENQ